MGLTIDGGRRKIRPGLTTTAVILGLTAMARAIPRLGELEMQVLRLVWREQPCTERRITEMVQADRPLARTTVLKTMQRLEEKRLLVRQPVESGPILYRAAVPEESVLPTLIRRFVDGVLGGSAGPLAAFLAESGEGRLSAKDLAALRAIARKIGEGPEKAPQRPTDRPEEAS